MKKSTDPWLAMLDYRKTPTAGHTASPAQHLMSRRTRALLQTSHKLLKPEVVKGVPASIVKKREKAKATYDRHAQSVPELKQGDNVYIKPGKRNTAWIPGQIKSTLGCQSYSIATNNRETRRNRQQIRYFPQSGVSGGSPPVPEPTCSDPLVQSPVRPVVKSPVRSPVQSPARLYVGTPVQPLVQSPTQTPVQTPVQSPVQPKVNPTHMTVQHPVTRSGRIVKKPTRLSV